MYDPNSQTSREQLAVAMIAKITSCGFALKDIPGTNEAVYSRVVEGTDGKISVLVYTSIAMGRRGPEVRTCGQDAIRVCAVYSTQDGGERGIAKATARVYRTGTVTDIVDRTYGRMREVYKLAQNPERCSDCGAPKFVAKSKRLVCADVCWTRRNNYAAQTSPAVGASP